MAENWRVVRVEPRAETLASDEFARDGIRVFFPRIKVANLRLGHKYVPLFPGYLFIRFDSEIEGWPVFRQGHRVLGWLRFGDHIPSLADTDIEALGQGIDAINGKGGLWRQFKPGDQVRIESNGMDCLAEVIESAKTPEAKVRVLMSFMGRSVSALIPWEGLWPVETIMPTTPAPSRRTRGRGRWIRGARADTVLAQ